MKREGVLIDGGAAFVEAVVGWRAWEMVPDSGVVALHSIIKRRVQWPARRPLEAVCYCGPTCCACGIYAWDTTILAPWSPQVFEHNPLPAKLMVVGEVHLWGLVQVHEHGYRAQYGQPSALYVDETMHPRLRRLVETAALQYDVPLVTPEGAI